MSVDSDSSDDDMYGGLGVGGLVDVAEQESEEEEPEGGDEADGNNSQPIEVDPFQRIFLREATTNDDATNGAKTAQEEAELAYEALLGSPNIDTPSSSEPANGPVDDVDAADSAARDLGLLTKWIEASGGYVHPRLRMAPFKDSGVGGYLAPDPTAAAGGDSCSCAVGEVLIRVPAECIMFADAESTAGLQGPGTYSTGELKQLVLALALRAEMQLGEQSAFAPFIKTLPHSLASFPVLWSRRELELLCDASFTARQQLVAQSAALRREHAHVGRCLHRAQQGHDGSNAVGAWDEGTEYDWGCSLHEFTIAKLLVCSRCFGVGGKGDVALLPMVDMLNHSANPHVVLGKATANDDNSTNKEAGLKKENPLPPPPPPVAAASANPLSSIAETEASTTSTSSSDNQTPLKRDFVAATSFEGNRPGFVFGTGPQGLGYYEDNALSKTATAAAGAVGSKGDSSSSEGTGFTLILAREVTDGEEVFSTYDKAGTRADISWLLNYGFVPGDSSGAIAAAEATSRLEAYAAAKLANEASTHDGTDKSPTPPIDPVAHAAAEKLATAAAALEACGPHTHGAVRLLQRERACLLAAAIPT